MTLLLCGGLNVSAQQGQKGNGKISGVVIDSLVNNPVEFANVALLEPVTKKPVDGAVCDEKGRFVITKVPRGQFILSISFIGFTSKELPIFLSDRNDQIDLGLIPIASSSQELEAVVIEGQKAIVEEKVDRTIYNAENDLTTKGGDATDVLKRVPLLAVDMDGNVSIRGSGNVKVLINNKPSTITASSVADALKQIPADMIKTVEVITSPSSKYDAEGSAGIINIVLKKNTLEGTFFNVDGSAGSRGSNLSLGANYRRGKMGFSLGAFLRATYNVNSNYDNLQTTRINGDTTRNSQQSFNHSRGEADQLTFGWDFDIDKKNVLALSARYGTRDQLGFQDHLLTTKTPIAGISTSRLQNVKTTGNGDNFDASLNYTRLFAKKDREFNLMAIYSVNNAISGFVTDSLSQSDFSVLKSYKNDNTGQTKEGTLQLDFLEPLAAGRSLEFGVKGINRVVTSTYDYSQAGPNGEYAPWINPLLSNGFNYDQSITSGYLSFNGTILNHYALKAGGRYEYTAIHAYFENQPAIAIPSYGVLVPAINLSRKLANGRLVKLAYNRRIQRPQLQELNPNLQASNGLNATIGNPYLKPEYTDQYEISYKTYFKSATVNLSTYLRNNTNDIQQARSVRNDTILSIYQNIGTEANYGASIFITLPVNDNFTLNGGIEMFYRILKNNSNDPFINGRNEGFVKHFRLFGTYNLPRGWGVQFFAFLQGRNYNLQGYRTNPFNHSISIKKDVMKKKGQLMLGADNFLTPTYKVYSELNSSFLQQSTTTSLYNAIIRVNFSYKIGKPAPERKRKSASDEDN